MIEAAFPPPITAALDRCTVPNLPQGFTDRLIERAQLRAEIASLPATRRAGASPWKRTGRAIASVAAISLFAAAAAAGGIFGNPVYVPGITEAMQHANIIERKPPVIAQHHAAKRTAIAASTTVPAPALAPIDGKDKAKTAISVLRADPRFQQLRPRQKRRAILRETRSLVQSGEITRQEGRTALRETAKENFEKLTPQQQQVVKQRMQKAKERRKLRRELRQEHKQGNQQNSAPQEPLP